MNDNNELDMWEDLDFQDILLDILDKYAPEGSETKKNTTIYWNPEQYSDQVFNDALSFLLMKVSKK